MTSARLRRMLAARRTTALLPDQKTKKEDVMNRWALAVALAVLLAPSLGAAADDYPSRPIRAIASQGPGGLSDLFMRALGDQLGPALGTSIVVEDRVGAEGTVGAKACAEAAPGRYTLFILPRAPTVT